MPASAGGKAFMLSGAAATDMAKKDEITANALIVLIPTLLFLTNTEPVIRSVSLFESDKSS
jgi:hypothetical protein